MAAGADPVKTPSVGLPYYPALWPGVGGSRLLPAMTEHEKRAGSDSLPCGGFGVLRAEVQRASELFHLAFEFLDALAHVEPL